MGSRNAMKFGFCSCAQLAKWAILCNCEEIKDSEKAKNQIQFNIQSIGKELIKLSMWVYF